MRSLTLKNLPEELLRDLREAAARDRRSLTQEIIHLLESTLQARTRAAPRASNVDVQVAAWRELAGKWDSDIDETTEVEELMKRRTSGREIDL